MPKDDQQISVVMPVALTETHSEAIDWRSGSDKGQELRLELAFRTFSDRFPDHQIRDFLIVAPESQVEPVRRFSARFPELPNVTVLSERSILLDPVLSSPGWYLQQMIKLAAAEILTTDFYLTLDADIVCMREWSVEDLVSDQRALMNIETIEDYMRLYNADHVQREVIAKTRRYRSSASILGYQRNVEQFPFFYGETPVMLHRNGVLNLLEHLEQRHRKSWQLTLSSHRKWTEYGLYFQYLEASGKLAQHHQPAGCDTVLDLSRSVWQASEWYRESRAYDSDHFRASRPVGYFVAIQSWLNPDHWLPERCASLEAFYAELGRFLGYGIQKNSSQK